MSGGAIDLEDSRPVRIVAKRPDRRIDLRARQVHVRHQAGSRGNRCENAVFF